MELLSGESRRSFTQVISLLQQLTSATENDAESNSGNYNCKVISFACFSRQKTEP